MRLICGVWNLDGRPVSPADLEAMCEAQQSPHRRAAVQSLVSGSMGLAVMDFQNKDEGDLLRRGGDGTLLAADVRLDEPDEARQAASLPYDADDAAIAAAVLETDALASLAGLVGDFALAGWNEREQRLRLCRDAMGIRPLVYHYAPARHVVFASFPAGVFASGRVPRALDEEQLGLEVLRVYTADATLFRDLRAVKPGHLLEFTPGGVRETCFWQPTLRDPLRLSPEDAAAHLRSLLSRAVTSAIRGAGPVATHLSGGLDSSGLAVLAARELRGQGRTLRGYSFLGECWPGLTVDGEEPFVAAVLQQESDIAWKAITHTLAEDWLHDTWSENAAVSLSPTTPDNAICADAAKHGVHRILSGWGGDEGVTFNGRGALSGAFRNLRWLYLARELRALQRVRNWNPAKVFLGEVLQPHVPAAMRGAVRHLFGRGASPTRPEPMFLSETLRSRLTGNSLLVALPDARAAQLQLLRSAHLAQRTNYYATLAAQQGQAFCFPMLNRRVVEFALSMQPTWHIRDGWKRRVYRDAMVDALPAAIRERHTKLVPLPGANYEFARNRVALVDRLNELKQNPAVTRRFNVERFQEIASGLPRPNDVVDPTAEPAFAQVPSMAHTLAYVFFVEQHFSGE